MSLFLFSGNVIQGQIKSLRATENLIVRKGAIVSRTFAIEARREQVIALTAKQNGADFKLELFAPNNERVAVADFPFSSQETERIFVVAQVDGKYLLKINSKLVDESGSLAVQFAELKTAADADVKRAAAEKLFAEADALRVTGKTSNRRKAVALYQQSLLIWQEIKDESGELRALTALAYLLRNVGETKLSLELAEQVLRFPAVAENLPHHSDAMYQIGQHHFNNGKISQAFAAFHQALALLPETSPKRVGILVTLANLYQSTSEFDNALQFFERAFENLRVFPDVYNQAQARHLYGLCHFNLDDDETAIKNFTIAANLREKFGNRRGQAISLSLLGMSLHSLGKYDEALPIFQKALLISQELEDKINQLDTLIYISQIYQAKGDLQSALRFYDQAFALFSQKSGSTALSSFHLSRGVTYAKLSNLIDARRDFEKAESLYRRAGDIGGEARVLYQSAKLERDENKLDAAREKIERALQIHEYEQAQYKNVRHLTSLQARRKAYFDLQIDILMRLEAERPNQGFAVKALQTSENARMRTLIWQYREAVKNSPQSVDYQIVAQIQKNQQQIGEQLSLLAKTQTDGAKSNQVRDIEKTIAEFFKQDESLKSRLRQTNPNVAHLAQPPTLSLAAMQAELDDDAVLIEYSLGETNSYLWIIGKNDFQSFTLPKRSEIDAQAKIFYETLNPIAANASTKSAKNLDLTLEAEKLSRLIGIEKLANLKSKKLIFVADGALNLIPFAALPLSGANGKGNLLIEKFEILQLPSLTTLHVLRQTNPQPFAPASIGVIADPVFSVSDQRLAKIKQIKKTTAEPTLAATLRDFDLKTLSRLPLTRVEAEKIFQNAPQNTTLNLDFKASRERIFNGEFDRFDILHFATHGFLNQQHPELSGVVLSLFDDQGNAQNGFLRTQDLFLLNLKPQMVILSACQTGLGKQIENEGLVGLTRSFLTNGTPRVVAAMWKVDDTATAELMTRFYRNLLTENQAPATALRAAQNELRQIPRFSHPRFWAGFTLTGEWR